MEKEETKKPENQEKIKDMRERIIEEQKRIKELDKKREEIEKEEKEEKEKLERDKDKLFEMKEKSEEDLDGQKIFNFFKSKKGKWILISIALLMIIILGSWIRVQNLPLLIDETNGEYIPIALDPFYFLRIAETLAENGGNLQEYDEMRFIPGKPVGWLNEILPKVIFEMWRISNLFGEYSIGYITIISPVIIFILGLIVFFFLILALTKSKIIAIISSLFLAITPGYLYRTMAGFADHEGIGVLGFFATLLVYSYFLGFLDREEKLSKKFLYKSLAGGLLLGLTTAFTQVSWGGIVRFIHIIIPLSFAMFWLLKTRSQNYNEIYKGYLLFYLTWIITSFTIPVLYGYKILESLNAYLFSTTGMAILFLAGFIFIEILYLKILKEYIPKNYQKFRIGINILLTVLGGIIFLMILGKDVISLFSDLILKFSSPFAGTPGSARLGLTVAENKQPYLNDWIGQIGKILFYFFVSGMLFVGFNIMKSIRKNKDKFIFISAWFLFILGFLFSRISPNSPIMNGETLISQLFYFGSFLFLIYAFIKVYYISKNKLDSSNLIIFAWLVLMLITGRGAIRLFFIITPFMTFMVGYGTVNLFEYARKSKDNVVRISFFILLAFAIVFLLVSFSSQFTISKNQATHTGPSANSHWQNAMEWVRLNTSENSVFSHWWDYGYWVEYLGERRTIADGGHFQGEYRNHMIGRYILTNPYPDFTLSFLKSNEVNYLLVDQTDIGKYPAYATIGSNKEWDRVSNINAMISNIQNIKETSQGQVRIYEGARGVEDDLIYNDNGTELFLPGANYNLFGTPDYKSYIGGVELEIINSVNGSAFEQPKGLFFYKNEMTKIPLRYLYFEGRLYDFESGLNSTVYIIPSIIQIGQNQQVDSTGALLYLSERTMNSLIAQLFLMDDAFGRYGDSMKLVHTESHPIIKNLKMNGLTKGEFVYYQGVQGPIKIWEVNAPEDILVNEEFTRSRLDYAEFDELKVRK